MKILLDYVFPITVVTPTPAASTAFIKQVGLAVIPSNEEETGAIVMCTSMAQVAGYTANTEAQQLFNAGMSRVFLVLTPTLDMADLLTTDTGNFFTLLISSDFDDGDIGSEITTPAVFASKRIGDVLFTAKHAGTAGNSIAVILDDSRTDGGADAHASGTVITVHMEDGVTKASDIIAAIVESTSSSALVTATLDAQDDHTGDSPQDAAGSTLLENGAAAILTPGTGLLVGTFDGVIGVSSDDADFCADQTALSNRCAFFTASENGAKNMCFAFGSLLSNRANWLNQQYITMPFDDGVDTLGDANSLFDDKVSFVLHDEEFGNRLALFCAEGKAIVAPYILKNLRVDLQSASVQWISLNEPQYTIKEASLLETRLQEDVINSYISRNWIESGSVDISLVEQNFTATGEIEVPQPKALWRVFSEMRETL